MLFNLIKLKMGLVSPELSFKTCIFLFFSVFILPDQLSNIYTQGTALSPSSYHLNWYFHEGMNQGF